MPSALAITRSSGVVMNPRTRSALAPTYTVDTFTTAMSLRGYCRTLSARIDCSPARRMTRLTTTASTGRRTKRSVNFIYRSSGRGDGLLPGCTLLFTNTAAPVRSLKTPDVTTSSPGFTPDTTATWSPRVPPSFTNC